MTQAQAQQAFMGIDIGTTSTKSVVFGPGGDQLGSYSVEYPLLRDRLDWAEQDPETIVDAVVDSVRGALAASDVGAEKVAGVGMGSAMHALIAVDAGGRPLTRSITWADGRSEEEARRLRATPEGHGIYRRTGTPIHPMSPLPKLIWLREHRPDVWSASAKFVSIKEYVVFRLFGEWVVDHAIATATGLMELDRLAWDEEALRIAGISSEQLSAVQSATYRLQGMDVGLADRMGLPVDTPFFLGGSDGALANMGVGAIGPGEMAVTIGTSATVRMMTDRPLTDERQRTFCYHVADTAYIIGGATNNGGIALQWMREAFFGAESQTEDVLEAASRVAAGADGLLFLPYLTGERAPIYTSEARGTYFGAHLGHKREHFARAGLEGVMLALASVAGALRDLAGETKEVRASGGFARSPLWKQMLADVLGMEVQVSEVTEASALASAALAMQGLGELGNWREIKAWIPIAERLEPNAHHAERYRELLEIHEELRGQLAGSFSAVARFQRKYAERE
ncbi:gluconokinase [Cohnella soli]|uniref:Gluconokinase n=1 Tax=Cohnella soli TaxID=425005 RepID=A0ABW0HZH1_9BACL